MTKISSAYRLQKHLEIALLIGMVMAGISISAIYAQEPASMPDYVTWSPDGRILAVSGSYGIRLYNDVLQNLPPLEGATKPIVSVAWSPNSTRIASAGFDGSIQIWDTSNSKLVKTWQAHTDTVIKISWHPNSVQLASASVDKTAKIWDVNSTNQLFVFQHSNSVTDAKWNSDGTKLATSTSHNESGLIQIWDVATHELVLKIDNVYGLDIVRSIAWSPDNKALLVVGRAPYIFDTATGNQTRESLPTCSPGSSIGADWNVDGSQLAITGIYSSGSIMCVETFKKSPTPILFNSRYNDIISIDWSRSGNKIAAATENGVLYVIDPVNGTKLASTVTPKGSFSNVGNLLFSCVVPESELDTQLRNQIDAGQVSAFLDTLKAVEGTENGIDPECVDVLTQFADHFTPSPNNLAAKVSACVTDKGLYNSLSVELSQQNYTPFINEVKAQRGKKIETQCADEMIEMATFLLNQPTATPTPKK